MGNYSFNLDHPLIDGPWAYWQTGQWGNGSRRFPSLYPNTPPQDSPEKAAFDQSVQNVKNAPFLGDLAVLTLGTMGSFNDGGGGGGGMADLDGMGGMDPV